MLKTRQTQNRLKSTWLEPVSDWRASQNQNAPLSDPERDSAMPTFTLSQHRERYKVESSKHLCILVSLE